MPDLVALGRHVHRGRRQCRLQAPDHLAVLIGRLGRGDPEISQLVTVRRGIRERDDDRVVVGGERSPLTYRTNRSGQDDKQ